MPFKGKPKQAKRDRPEDHPHDTPYKRMVKKRNFDIGQDGNCPRCQNTQTLKHILDECVITDGLRQHLRINYQISRNLINFRRETPEIILLYQKMAISSTIEYNKTGNTLQNTAIFEKAMDYYDITRN